MAEQEDLTAEDHRVQNTVKVFPADDKLTQPLQDPHAIPLSVVDENGRQL